MTEINAYISFNGQCREAMNFYKECLGGELTFQTIEGSPVEAQCPGTMKNQIAHSSLIKNELVLFATDMTGHGGFIKGNNMSLMLNCSSEEEINNFYSKLSEGGQITETLKTQFWGALFGVVTDKFGIVWMINYNKN
jgi:PhnB protein